MSARTWLRAGLVLLTLAELAVGAVQLVAPKAFYDVYWVSLLPPFNDHLMRDMGALNMAVALVLGVGAVAMERRLVYTALAAFTFWVVVHFGYHAMHLEHFPAGHAIAQTSVLGLVVVLPLAMLPLVRRGTTAAAS